MTVRAIIAASALALGSLAGCNIDFGADIPCDGDGDCPKDHRCDMSFFRCVESGGGAGDADEDVDRDTDVPDTTPDSTDDAPEDSPSDVPVDAPEDTPADTPVDGSGDAPPDVPADVPADGSGDTGCVPTGAEVCDGVDNDCNGTIDDPPVCDAGPCGAGMVLVDRGETGRFCIDEHEASRQDATATSPGADGTVATSRPGVIPWATISWVDAGAACTAAGKRLCTAFEWQSACQGPTLQLYPYGNSYQASSCNGSNTPPLDSPAPTGSFSACRSSDGVMDQSGNLSEWTSDMVLRGGAFADPQLNLRCSSRTSDSGGSPLPTYGFRCCKDAP